jgi:hypothetical protein
MSEIQKLIEERERCRATLVESRVVTVRLHDDSEPFSRAVQTFALHGHPARRAYAWEQLGEGKQTEPNYTVVLAAPGIHSPEDALKSVLKAFLGSI